MLLGISDHTVDIVYPECLIEIEGMLKKRTQKPGAVFVYLAWLWGPVKLPDAYFAQNVYMIKTYL